MEMETAAEEGLAADKATEVLIEEEARVVATSHGETTSQAATVQTDTVLRINNLRKNTGELG